MAFNTKSWSNDLDVLGPVLGSLHIDTFIHTAAFFFWTYARTMPISIVKNTPVVFQGGKKLVARTRYRKVITKHSILCK
jgi:hypothetical protein